MCDAGVMSFGTWFWPEGSSDSMEALMSVAVSGKGKAVTVGMTGGKMYYSDMLHVRSHRTNPQDTLQCHARAVESVLELQETVVM